MSVKEIILRIMRVNKLGKGYCMEEKTKIELLYDEFRKLIKEMAIIKQEGEELGEDPMWYLVHNHEDKVDKYLELTEILKFYEQSKKRENKNEMRKFVIQNRNKILEYYDNKCFVCNFNFQEILEIHHITALKYGGNNDLENLKVLCPTCHRLIHLLLSKKLKILEPYWIEENYSQKANQRLMELFQKGVRGRYATTNN